MAKIALKKIVVGEVISHLAAMGSDVTGKDFTRYFGDTRGALLWNKFSGQCGYSLVILWQLGDSQTRGDIESFITQWERV